LPITVNLAMCGQFDITIIRLGGEIAGPLGRRECLFAHAREEDVFCGDVTGGWRANDADSAGVIAVAREAFVGRNVEKQAEQFGARAIARLLPNPGIQTLKSVEMG